MSGDRSENSGNRTAREVPPVSASAEAASLVRQIAEPWQVGDTVKAAINRVARRVGLKPSRVEDIWRREARVIRAEEMDAIRAAADRQALEGAQGEYQRLSERIAALEALLAVQDADIRGSAADERSPQAGAAHRALGGRDVAREPPRGGLGR